jgi:hypothetical protein
LINCWVDVNGAAHKHAVALKIAACLRAQYRGNGEFDEDDWEDGAEQEDEDDEEEGDERR